jgi:ATP-dependent Clp protease ATP-binding subunit ClpA
MFDKMFRKRSDDIMPIDPEILSPESRKLEDDLLKKVIGQDRAVHQLVHTYQIFRSGLQTPHKPLGVLLFLGPTGSGKTKLVESLAECIFGSSEAMIKIDCAEFSHDHEIAKLIGAPPGYLGHGKTEPRLTQQLLNKHHRPDLKLSILLFDEIEKGCEDLHHMMLGIMSAAKLTLGDNTVVDLSNTLIIMTSNEGSGDMQKIITGGGLGFTSEVSTDAEIDDLLWQTAKDALKKKFAPEFVNRISRSIVFHTLNEESLKKIADIEIEAIQDRILLAGYFILLRVTDAAKDYIRKEGTDPIYGARELNRALDHLLVEPMSNLLATKQVTSRDMLIADYESGTKLIFTKMEGVIDPPPEPNDPPE